MRDAFPHISTPPSEEVRWQVSCRYLDSERVRWATAEIVTARTWVRARELAYRAFAARGIYEPEQLDGFVIRDARPIAKPEHGSPRSKECTPRATSGFSSRAKSARKGVTSRNGSNGALSKRTRVQGGL